MPCLCLVKMNEFLDSMAAQAPALQAGLPNLPSVPDMAALPQMTELSTLAGGMAALEANAAMNIVPPEIKLPSPGELAKLEAMAQVAGGLGVNVLGPNAQAELNMAAGGLNINAPAMSELAAGLPPILAPLAGMPQLAGLVTGVQAAFGVNLMAPGAMPELSAKLGMAAASPAVAGAANFDGSASMAAGMAARLANASAALGIDLTAPGGEAQLAAALEMAASLDMPAISTSIPEFSALTGMMSTMEAANQAMGVNLMTPGLGGDLEASGGLPAMEANLANLEANLATPLGLSAEAEAQLAVAAEAGMNMAAGAPAAGMNFGAMAGADMSGLPAAPSMEPMAMAATFAAAFEGATGIQLMSEVPCPNMFCTA